MRKRSKYRPRPVHLDTMLLVKSGILAFSKVPEGLSLRIKNNDSLNNIRLGVGTKYDIEILRHAFNITEALGRLGKGSIWADEIKAGQAALKAIATRGMRNSLRFVATGPELTALNLAMEIHDAQLDVCTVQDIERAAAMVVREIKHKRAEPLLEKT